MPVKNDKMLVLEIERRQELLKVRSYTSGSPELQTVSRYDDLSYHAARVEHLCHEVIRLLHNANLRGNHGGDFLAQLKTTGFALFETLLSPTAQAALCDSDLDSLMLNIDDHLVHIPWELLYTGSDFLCTRFSMGRMVQARRAAKQAPVDSIASPARVLLLCDPQGDLPQAYQEGDRIRAVLDQSDEMVHADLLNRKITHETLQNCISSYDIVHYAGHAEHLAAAPADSGWRLLDRKFTAADVERLSHRRSMPHLIFANACQSGHTAAWTADQDTFGLAHAFLISGVQHYIGTVWEVLDETSCALSAEFYRQLVAGRPIGAAMRAARLHIIETCGQDNLGWAGYVLYGPPGRRYFAAGRLSAADRGSTGHGFSAPPQAAARRALPADRKTFRLTFVAYAVIAIALLFGYTSLRHLQRAPANIAPQSAGPATAPDAKQPDIAAVISALSEKYRQQQRSGGNAPPAHRRTPPLTLSVLGFTPGGNFEAPHELARYFTRGLARALVNGSRFQVLERRNLTDILAELQISTADIADQSTALAMLGKILGARFIAIGEIVRLQQETALSLRVIETATSRIGIALHIPVVGNDYERALAELTGRFTARFDEVYPLEGTVAACDNGTVTLSLGAAQGVRTGDSFETLPDAEGRGRLLLTARDVRSDSTIAVAKSAAATPRAGQSVRLKVVK